MKSVFALSGRFFPQLLSEKQYLEGHVWAAFVGIAKEIYGNVRGLKPAIPNVLIVRLRSTALETKELA